MQRFFSRGEVARRVPEDEYQEVTLADIVRVLYRRKLVLASAFLLVLLGGIAYAVFADREYESTTTLVPLAHGDIIKNWLDSRHAAELVSQDLGDPLLKELFPSRWDAGEGNWSGEPPSPEEAGRAIERRTTVSFREDARFPDRFVSVSVRMHDPLLARDVAAAYVRSLDELRPQLEDITRQEAFDRYYDGSNQQEAERRAEVTAKQMDYWLPLDAASTPRDPVSPNVTLTVALSVVLGLLLAVFAAFFVEWVARYRTEHRTVEAPPAPTTEAEPAKRPEGRRYS